ncbi:MAG: hypothetical protein GJ680_06345 [Alteromonadaceae bacterium]|nr:hypothetical protein [Alteromonadaceae bacterium]
MDWLQLMEIAVSLSNRLDTHWTLFITVHLALIGGIIYVDRPLKRPEKWAAILVYTGFAAINFLMMVNLINFQNSLYIDLIAMKNQPCCEGLASIAYIERLAEFGSFKTTRWSIAGVHLAMYILVTISIINDSVHRKSGKQLASDNSNEPQ